MDKINYITEPYDETGIQPPQQPIGITYDDIMNRLTRHFIRQEVSNNNSRNTPPHHIEYKPNPTSEHITSKKNKSSNSDRMPGYIKPYKGQPITGYLNTPSGKPNPNVHTQQNIGDKIQTLIDHEKNGDLGVPLDMNRQEMETKYLMMRRMALRNQMAMSEKLRAERAEKTQMKFQ